MPDRSANRPVRDDVGVTERPAHPVKSAPEAARDVALTTTPGTSTPETGGRATSVPETAPARPWYGGSDRPEIVVPRCPNCAHWDAEPGAEPALRCANCGWYWYPNPRPTAAVVIEREAENAGADPAEAGHAGLEFLLLRRAMDPAAGWWDLPAGFLEPRETPDEGALREAREEAGFSVRLTGLIGAYASRESNTVVFAYTARALDPDAIPEPDHESTESRWIPLHEVDTILPTVAFAPIRDAILTWRDLRLAGPAEEARDAADR
jgi:ADP-ribose pyrophosphatase YjhB (NUDIX family)